MMKSFQECLRFRHHSFVGAISASLEIGTAMSATEV